MILAGDIGGTKTYLALYDENVNWLENIVRFENRNYPDFDSILEEFFQGNRKRPEKVCLGVAGPIVNGSSDLTNIDWRIDAGRLEKEFDTVFLINDLVATACAVPFLEDEDIAILQTGKTSSKGRISVVAAGTGLGEAFLIPAGEDKYYVLDSEGGHADFSPRNKLETELLLFLKRKFSRISIEQVVSGPGLIHIFEFVKEKFSINESVDWENGLPEEKLASEIINRAVHNQSQVCEKTLLLFAELYGALAGNLALQFLAKGGVYLGGGIAPKILPFLTNGKFIEGFLSKNKFENLLADIPVKVILNEKAALLGAARYALGERFKIIN